MQILNFIYLDDFTCISNCVHDIFQIYLKSKRLKSERRIVVYYSSGPSIWFANTSPDFLLKQRTQSGFRLATCNFGCYRPKPDTQHQFVAIYWGHCQSSSVLATARLLQRLGNWELVAGFGKCQLKSQTHWRQYWRQYCNVSAATSTSCKPLK